MDIHPVEGKIESLKDFLLHLLTITVGILIALGLEGISDLHHHHVLVQEAKVNLDNEIQDNQREVLRTSRTLIESERQLIQILSALHNADPKQRAKIKGMRFVWEMPELHSTSWTTASATKALSYMDYSEVKRYTRIYDLQLQYEAQEDGAIATCLEVSRMEMPPVNEQGQLAPGYLAGIEKSASLCLAHAELTKSVGQELEKAYGSP